MKTPTFQKDIGGTAACIKRLMMATKWFSAVETAEEAMDEGLYYCGPVKMTHQGLCLYTLE